MHKTHTIMVLLCSSCCLIRHLHQHIVIIILKLFVHGLKTSHVSAVPQEPNVGKYWPRATLWFQRLESKSLPEVNEPVQDGARAWTCTPASWSPDGVPCSASRHLHAQDFLMWLLNLFAQLRNSLCILQSEHINGLKRGEEFFPADIYYICQSNPNLCMLMRWGMRDNPSQGGQSKSTQNVLKW